MLHSDVLARRRPLLTAHARRSDAIARAATAKTFGVILGTLGRQGNPGILQRLLAKLDAAGRDHFVLLLSEIMPAKVRRCCASLYCVAVHRSGSG